jgi:hypothetical protein
MPPSDFSDPPLTPLEQTYREKLLAVFARVQPKYPEKGVMPLIRRARELAIQQGLSDEAALETVYQGAVTRTEARIQLLMRCDLKPPTGE